MPPKKSPSNSSEPTIQSIAIADIRMDGGTQPRSQLYGEVVAEYAEDMKDGADFPPVTVYYDGKKYWLADGFHRVRAKEALGNKKVAAEVYFGTQRDAVLFAVGANAEHGLRRTNADKRRAVERLLRDHEWSRWSDREISRICGVSSTMVNNLRKSLESPEQDTGRDDIFISDDPSKIRFAQRGGKTYEIDTTNLSKTNQRKTISSKRKRAKKQAKSSSESLNASPKRVQPGEVWKLGRFHFLFCGNPDSDEFQQLLPSEISLLLVFPQSSKQWPQIRPKNARSVVVFDTPFGEDLHLETLRGVIENSLAGTTDANDPVVIINLLDPSLFILIDDLQCRCCCAEPDPQRCSEALTAWSITKQPSKKI